MEGVRRRPRRYTVYREVWRAQDRSKRKKRRKGKVSTKKEGERGETLTDILGVKGRYWDENAFARPNGLREKLKLRLRVEDLDLPERRDIPVVGRRRKWMHICARVAQQ